MTDPASLDPELTAHRRGVLLGLAAVGAAMTLGLALVFAKLADAAMEGDGLTRLDPSITDWLVDHRSPWLTEMMRAISRVYLGVHWASDVLSGWVLAAMWLATLVTALALATRSRSAP